jgi:hypothetical protein
MWPITPSLLDKIEKLEHENIETSNCLHEIYTNLETLENKLMYENLSEFERALARFGDKVALIAGMEITDKIAPEEAYQMIKEEYKELKSLRKKEKEEWNG